ncbi:MAG: hypothetical protein Q8N39_11265 [Pelolinea sp.]|nr:hypothetical protein [Pelolinea sp.]
MDTLEVIQISKDLPLSLAIISPGIGVQSIVAIGPVSVGKGVIGYIVNFAASVDFLTTTAVPVAKSGESVCSGSCRTFAIEHSVNNKKDITNNNEQKVFFIF